MVKKEEPSRVPYNESWNPADHTPDELANHLLATQEGRIDAAIRSATSLMHIFTGPAQAVIKKAIEILRSANDQEELDE